MTHENLVFIFLSKETFILVDDAIFQQKKLVFITRQLTDAQIKNNM